MGRICFSSFTQLGKSPYLSFISDHSLSDSLIGFFFFFKDTQSEDNSLDTNIGWKLTYM